MKPWPNIYFVPWPLGTFSFSTSYMVCPSKVGCGIKGATSTGEGTLFREGILFAMVEVVGLSHWTYEVNPRPG